ncbi:hypothetical protein CWI80_09310 [Pseudidiomarina sediminum]|uniref:Lipoprotein n=1 Tax=Pseudidiomarina sediminum TaxID=431675 RepID=A0A432Z2D8_9GAMM|nr:hypothetical protein [Pseudidiomarina sediminum]RUO71993.1 hypothetical protein CWI80_09310 [Pseudidiomarina sediminum]
MKKVFYTLCFATLVTGCAEPDTKRDFNATVTFPVNNQCHEYVTQLPVTVGQYEVSYKPFTVKLDAFPQITGFMELRSNNMMNVELQNEAIKMMDNCFARAKTAIDVTTPDGWLNAGKAIQANLVNDVPVHSLVLNGSVLEIYYNWDDKESSR